MAVPMQPLQCLLLAFVAVMLDAQGSRPSQQTAMTEIHNHSIPIKFYQLSKSQWLEGEPKFQRALAGDANDFCRVNHTVCGLPLTWHQESTFKEQNVKFRSTKEDRIYFSLEVYVLLPFNLSKSSLTKTKHVLHKDVTSALMTKSRKELSDGIGAAIVVINEDDYSPSPDITRNSVLICLALLVVLVISAVAIYFKLKENKAHKHQQMKVMQQKPENSSENVAIVRPSEKEPRILVTSPEAARMVDSPPMMHYSEPASNDHQQRKPERESFLHLRGRQAPYAVPESTKILSPQDKVHYKPWSKQSEKSGPETSV